MHVLGLNLGFSELGEILDENGFTDSSFAHNDDRNARHYSEVDYRHLDDVIFREHNVP